MAIKASIKKKWVAALRSGDYKQGAGNLCKNMSPRHCCLGVLADIVDPERNTWEGSDNDFGHPDNKQQRLLLGGYLSNRKLDKLVNLNDDKGLSFKDIAAFISKDRFI